VEVYELSVWHLTWDIIHPGLIEFEERIIKKGKNIVAAIIGKSYVGKSWLPVNSLTKILPLLQT
jgi:hypothetical protein